MCNNGVCYDWLQQCSQFTKLYQQKTGKTSNGKVNRKFITSMVMDELKELEEAKDETEEIDALLDITYFLLQHLSTLKVDVTPIWHMIHLANMTKFEKGHLGSDGKWMKPQDFTAPDDDIRKYLQNPDAFFNKNNQSTSENL